jgi:hypothetical protein
LLGETLARATLRRAALRAVGSWDTSQRTVLRGRYVDILAVHHLTREATFGKAAWAGRSWLPRQCCEGCCGCSVVVGEANMTKLEFAKMLGSGQRLWGELVDHATLQPASRLLEDDALRGGWVALGPGKQSLSAHHLSRATHLGGHDLAPDVRFTSRQ